MVYDVRHKRCEIAMNTAVSYPSVTAGMIKTNLEVTPEAKKISGEQVSIRKDW